jgi:hypothetical protein
MTPCVPHLCTHIRALLSVLGTLLFASSIIAILVHACSQTGAPASRHVTQHPTVTDHLVVTVLRVYDARRFVSFLPQQRTKMATAVSSRQLWRHTYRKGAFFKCAVWRFVGSNFCYFARHASLIFIYPVFRRTSGHVCSSYVSLYVYMQHYVCVCVRASESAVETVCVRLIWVVFKGLFRTAQ